MTKKPEEEGASSLEQQIKELEYRMASVEDQLTRLLKHDPVATSHLASEVHARVTDVEQKLHSQHEDTMRHVQEYIHRTMGHSGEPSH